MVELADCTFPHNKTYMEQECHIFSTYLILFGQCQFYFAKRKLQKSRDWWMDGWMIKVVKSGTFYSLYQNQFMQNKYYFFCGTIWVAIYPVTFVSSWTCGGNLYCPLATGKRSFVWDRPAGIIYTTGIQHSNMDHWQLYNCEWKKFTKNESSISDQTKLLFAP